MSRVTGSLNPLTAELSEQLRVHLRRMLVRLDELRALASNPATWTPPVDVYETEGAVLIHIELPGVHISQVRIKILDNVLKIEGQKERTTPTARLLPETERPIRLSGTKLRQFQPESSHQLATGGRTNHGAFARRRAATPFAEGEDLRQRNRNYDYGMSSQFTELL